MPRTRWKSLGGSRSISASESAWLEKSSDAPSEEVSPDTIWMSSSSSKRSSADSGQLLGELGPQSTAPVAVLNECRGAAGQAFACSLSQSRMRLTRPSPLSSMLLWSSPKADDRNRLMSSVDEVEGCNG